jgi:hypothetical protein
MSLAWAIREAAQKDAVELQSENRAGGDAFA